MMEFEDKLDNFLKGRMNNEEEQEFKILLASNPNLKQKAIATARMAKAMHIEGEKSDREIIGEIKAIPQDNIKAIAEKVCDAKQSKIRILPFRRFVISFSVAASILICIFGGYKYYRYEQITSLGQEYLAYFPANEFSRGEDNRVSDRLQKLYTNISEKNELKSTINELNEMWNDSRSDSYNVYTEYMPELGWMLATAYLRDNEKGKAIEVLNQLISECPADTAIGEKARELKETIENL